MNRASRRTFISIRWIVTGTAAALIAVAVLGVGFVGERRMHDALTAEIKTRILLDARTLALASSSAMLGDFPELTLHPLVRELRVRQPELSTAVVFDKGDVIQGDADPRLLGSRYTVPTDLQPIATEKPLASGERLLGNDRFLFAACPVTHPNGAILGTVVVGVPRGYVSRAIAAARRQQTLVLLAFLLAGVAVASFLMSQLLRPIDALRKGIERVGRGELDTPVPLQDRTELTMLAEAINDMTAKLKAARAEMLERERLAHEMELAQQLQRSLLPSGGVVSDGFAVQGFHRAAAEVSGDYYDIIPMPGGRLGVAIADVAGKGLPGCLIMSMVSALLRAYRESLASPAALLAELDARLSETLQPGSFVTMFYGVLDPAERRLTFSSAGHNPALLYRAATGQVVRIVSKGIPLASIRGGAIRATLEDRVVELAAGDVLLAYTDGVSEAFDPSGREQFGLDRIEGVLARSAPEGPQALLEAVDRAIRKWTAESPALDDETLLVIQAEPSRAPLPLPLVPAEEGAAGLETLALARRTGRCLTLPIDLDAVGRVRSWLRDEPPYPRMSRRDAEVLSSALYEACANIVEHGYGKDDRAAVLELWWVPASGAREGCFLIRDEGRPFSAVDRTSTDFADPAVRRRGRGLGLEIIHRAMRNVSYFPGTPEGNITIYTFLPSRMQPAALEPRDA